MFDVTTQAALIDVFGERIARSRYEAWDSHRSTHTWEDYKVADPSTAQGIYLEDGRRDAEAIMPMLESVIDTSVRKMFAAFGLPEPHLIVQPDEHGDVQLDADEDDPASYPERVGA